MALFEDHDFERPAPRRPRSVQAILVFAAALILSNVYFWGSFVAFAANGMLSEQSFLLAIVFIVTLFMLLLQGFVLYRLLAELRLCNTFTGRLDAFFYESRLGSALLLFLCGPWLVIGTYALFFSFIFAADTFASWSRGHKGTAGGDGDGNGTGPAANFGSPFALVAATSPIPITIGVFWLCRTAYRAVYRVFRSFEADRGRYNGVPIGLDELRPDELRFRSDVRSAMSWGGRASHLMATTLPR